MTKFEMRQIKTAKQLDQQITRDARNLLKEIDSHLKHVSRKEKIRAARKARRQEEVDYRRFAKAKYKQCVNCGATKHTDEFPLDPSNNTQLRVCRPCRLAFVESYRK